MSSSSDKNLKTSLETFKVKPLSFKAKEKLNLDLINILKSRVHPELQEQRLLSAVSVHNTEAVTFLLESGVSSNSADRQLRSALHIAASRGYADLVKLLLDNGADPNRQDIIQNTPLHLAACTSNLQIITLLINGGADVSTLDMHGRNPIQLAESKLQMLQKSWKEGAIEMIQLRSQLQEIVDVMISLKKDGAGADVDNLKLMKLSLNTGPIEQVDDQMNVLLSELQQFTIK